MNRFLRGAFLGLAALLGTYAVLFARYFHAAGESILHAKTLWVAGAGVLFFVIAAWRFSVRARFRILLLVSALLVVEVLMQVSAWAGVLPAVNTKIRAPFARVYWSGEGRGNSIRNRFGWHYPEFDLKAAHRIAFIGDSQVEAVEVPRTRNQAFVLQTLLKQQSPEWSVLGLGSHGTCPAYSIDVLAYAARHFQPQDAIVVFSLGSDVTEASPALNGYPADQYLYYDLQPDSSLTLNPASASVRAAFQRFLEMNHRSLLVNLPVTLSSHCMLLQLGRSLRDAMATRRRQAELAHRAERMLEKEGREYQRIGFNPRPFALEPDAEARQAMAVLLGQLRRCKEVCDERGMTLRVVLIPAFPKAFYDSQHGREWASRIGPYDYFKPERELAEFARSNSIPVLPMGEYIRGRKLDVEEIRSLYFSQGVGHLTEKGHRLCAEAIFETFFRPPLQK